MQRRPTDRRFRRQDTSRGAGRLPSSSLPDREVTIVKLERSRPATGIASKTRRPKGRRGTPVPEAGSGRPDARDRRILELERENRRLKVSVQTLAEFQERVSRLLGIPLEREGKA